MKHNLLISVAAVAVAAGAMMGLSSTSAAQTPPMSGGYTNVIAIPVDDPAKNIAGALFKPDGAGPFPAVIYLGGCAPIGAADEAALEKAVVDHNRSKGFATLIVDSFAPRHLDHGVCDREHSPVWYGVRAADAHAAKDSLAAMPDIDAERIFLVGYNHGGQAALLAVDGSTAATHRAKFAGVVAYYPYCGFVCGCAVSVPTLIMVGDEDDLAPADRCRTLKDKPNVQVVIYPGAGHAFTTPGIDKVQNGHRLLYDAKAAADAQARADAFIATHMK